MKGVQMMSDIVLNGVEFGLAPDSALLESIVTNSDPTTQPDVSVLLQSEASARSIQPDSTSVQKQVLENLKLKHGILNGRDLYQQYGESNKDLLKTVIRSLEQQNLVSVKGNLENPLGVFQSVIVQI